MNTTTYESFPLTFDRIQPGMMLEITPMIAFVEMAEIYCSCTLQELNNTTSHNKVPLAKRVVNKKEPWVAVCLETHGPVDFFYWIKVLSPEHGVGLLSTAHYLIAEHIRELKEEKEVSHETHNV